MKARRTIAGDFAFGLSVEAFSALSPDDQRGPARAAADGHAEGDGGSADAQPSAAPMCKHFLVSCCTLYADQRVCRGAASVGELRAVLQQARPPAHATSTWHATFGI